MGGSPTIDASATFHIFFVEAPRPMYVFDRQTLAFLAVNDAAVEYYGYTVDEFRRMSLLDIRPPDDVPRLLTRLRDDSVKDVTWRHRRKDGKTTIVEVAWQPIDFDGRDAVLVIVTDVTDRERAREALRFSEARFRTVFERSPVGIALIGSDFRFLDVNPAFERLLGHSHQELTRMTFVDVTHPDDVGIDADLGRRVFAGELPSYTLEKRYVRSDGSVVWVQLSAAGVSTEVDGEIRGIAIVEDITERKDREVAGLRRVLDAERTLASMSRREREVADLLVSGCTASQLARSLFISNRTAESHIAAIYRKLDVRTRADAIARLEELREVTAHEGGNGSVEGEDAVLLRVDVP